jgi:predicted acylesterase/phospholipase RssA
MNAHSSRIGVVLSSGGGRGVYAHTGFLQALEQLGITISASAGCSAGAVVGGVVASGTRLADWSATIAQVKRKEFWIPDSLLYFFWRMTIQKGRGYTGLAAADTAIDFCQRNLTVDTFEQCRYPFYTVAVDLGCQRKAIFSQGKLAPRMMASAAMPVLYRPVEIDANFYCDGALIEMAPMDAICCKHGLDAVIIHHVSQRGSGDIRSALRGRWALLEIMNRLLFHQRPWYLADEGGISFHRCPCDCGAVVVVIEPELPALSWPLTEGGSKVQNAAKTQAVSLLQPYLEDLMNNPQEKLPDQPINRDESVSLDSGACK